MHYCKIRNYEGDMLDFLEKEEITGIGACLGLSTEEQGTETFFRKKKGLSDSYTTGGRTYTVDGPILSVEKYTMDSDAILAESLLGQADALDCFNMKAQDAAAIGFLLENMKDITKIYTAFGIEDAEKRAALMPAILGTGSTFYQLLMDVVNAIKQISEQNETTEGGGE
jgi:hypothetical protein